MTTRRGMAGHKGRGALGNAGGRFEQVMVPRIRTGPGRDE